MPPESDLFDRDHTLLDTWPAIHEAFNATLIAFGSGIGRSHKFWFAGDTDIDLAGAANSGCLDVPVRENRPPGPNSGRSPRPALQRLSGAFQEGA